MHATYIHEDLQEIIPFEIPNVLDPQVSMENRTWSIKFAI